MSEQPLPGWYADPRNPTSGDYRYWDGRAWSKFTGNDLSAVERVGSAGLPTGRYAWVLGFFGWIPIPFFGLMFAAAAMASVRQTGRLKGSAVCAENTRRAANWGLTMLTMVMLCVLYGVTVWTLVPTSTEGFFPLGAAVVAYFVLVLAHAFVTIRGTIVAGRGGMFNPRIAIPYFRR